MIGVRNRKRGLFGAQPTIGTPGIGEDVARAGMEQMPAGVGMLAQEPKKRSFLPYALAAVEDTLSRQMGYAPQGVARLNAMQAQQQQAAAEMAAEQRKRSMDLSDWKWKQDYERANPAPVNNDTVADYQFIRERLGDEAAQTYLRNRADPPQYRQGADGRFYRIETGQPQVLGQSLPEGWTIQGDGAGNSAGGF